MKYLLDTNVIIDYYSNKLSQKQSIFVEGIPILISIITRIELIGKFSANRQYIKTTNAFIKGATIYELNEKIILQTIDIRQKHKIELPDAIIAATAMANKLTLITHDVHDFKHIGNLKFIDSWSI